MNRLNEFGTVPGRKVNNLFIPDGVPNVWAQRSRIKWKMIYILTDGTRHSSWLLPSSEYYASMIAENGYAFVDDWRVADIIIALRDTDLSSFIIQVKRYIGQRPVLLYTHEPYFSNTPDSMIQIMEKKIHVMNCFTGNVWRSPLQYCPVEKAKDICLMRKPKKLSPYIALLATMKKGRGLAGKLASIRTSIGLEGHKLGIVHVYGKGWGPGISRGDTRMQYKATKPDILKNYHFNLCFENTYVQNYVTEKLWDSITNYCLPIYVGAPWIYKIFPKDSFLDYAKLGSTEALFRKVMEMTPKEWTERMNKCIEAFQTAALEVDDPLHETYYILFRKLNSLADI